MNSVKKFKPENNHSLNVTLFKSNSSSPILVCYILTFLTPNLYSNVNSSKRTLHNKSILCSVIKHFLLPKISGFSFSQISIVRCHQHKVAGNDILLYNNNTLRSFTQFFAGKWESPLLQFSPPYLVSTSLLQSFAVRTRYVRCLKLAIWLSGSNKPVQHNISHSTGTSQWIPQSPSGISLTAIAIPYVVAVIVMIVLKLNSYQFTIHIHTPLRTATAWCLAYTLAYRYSSPFF